MAPMLRETRQNTDYELNISTYSLSFKEILDEKTELNEFNKNVIVYSGCF